jgi:hypothetical protein
VAGTTDVDVNTFKVTKLFQGNMYKFRVFAENRVGPGEPAETAEAVEAKLPYGGLQIKRKRFVRAF